MEGRRLPKLITESFVSCTFGGIVAGAASGGCRWFAAFHELEPGHAEDAGNEGRRYVERSERRKAKQMSERRNVDDERQEQ